MRIRARTAVFALLLLLTDAIPASAASVAVETPQAAPASYVPAAPAPLAALSWRQPAASAAYAAATSDAPDSISSAVTLPGGSTVLRETAMAGAAIGVGFLLDDTIEPGSGEDTFLDNAGQALGSPLVLVGGTALMALYGWQAHAPKELNTAKRLALALAATSLTVVTLKSTTNRERPDESDDRSFPSGHTANTMAVATVLDREYDGVVPWIAYGATAFVGASRVAGNHHWFSDVMAGAVIGRFFGRLVTHNDVPHH
ncbi:MAG TPA: phosphatase PAP2 family protein [Candidatus Eisenbacteria bacterium]|jgi:membrane-associated phospholipid phosphatase|nr:phosphatase PAP2 family protein [Candidatus Eisenbacteria bacterium]